MNEIEELREEIRKFHASLGERRSRTSIEELMIYQKLEKIKQNYVSKEEIRGLLLDMKKPHVEYSYIRMELRRMIKS